MTGETEGIQANGEGRLDYGDEPFFVNELPQTRSVYDIDELVELADSMELDEPIPPYFYQEQPIQIAEFDNQDDLIAYIISHADFYGIEPNLDVSRFEKHPSGTWRILNFGHRRVRAIALIAQKYEYIVQEKDVDTKIVTNPSFEEMLVHQLRENIHVRPPITDEARAIARYRDYRANRFGRKPTITEIARKLGFSERKVSEALRFNELPDFIQQDVVYKQYGLDTALLLGRYLEAAHTYCGRKYQEIYAAQTLDEAKTPRTVAGDAEEMLRTLVNRIKKKYISDKSADKRTAFIQGSIRDLIGAAAYEMEALFVVEGAPTPKERSEASGRQMGVFAMNALLLRARTSQLSTEELDLLGQLTSLTQGIHDPLALREPVASLF